MSSTPTLYQVPLSRVINVELRKMFDTRSGFWLMASIVITGLLTTIGTIAFAPDADLTYYTFAKAIGFPMTVVLPIIAILSITGEWSQRSGLTTFTLVPHRNRVIAAKAVSSVAVAIASMLFAFVIGAIGNLVGTAIAGTDMVWDVSLAEGVNIVLGSLLCLLTGTMLGMLIRSSAGALVAYFVYSLLLPTVVRHPGLQPGVVPRPAAMGGPQLRPGRPVRGHPYRLSSGPTSRSQRQSGSSCPPSSGSGWS